MPKTFLLLCLLWPLTTAAQPAFNAGKISRKILALAEKIAHSDMVTNDAVGFSGERPKEYDQFWELKTKASEAELRELTRHPNPAVRCYAFWALAYRPGVDLLTPVLEHLRDTQQVETLFGCVGDIRKTGDFFIEVVTPDRIDADVRKLDAPQLARLDSALICTPNLLNARSDALERSQNAANQYQRIRNLALNEHDGDALVALAKYRKTADVPTILQLGAAGQLENNGNFYVYRAIRAFPHPDFLPFLEQQLRTAQGPPLRDANWRELFHAIAAYQNDKALELLRIGITNVRDIDKRETIADQVFQAARDNKNPRYDDLLLQLWRADRKVSLDAFEYLWSRFPEQALVLTRRDLLQANDLFNANILSDLSEPDAMNKLCAAMLDTLVLHDPKIAHDAIRENIARGAVYQYRIFTKKAAESRDPSFIEPLFQRLATESNPNVYLEAAKALLAYADPNIPQRLRQLQKSTPALQSGWGGKALRDLLQ